MISKKLSNFKILKVDTNVTLLQIDIGILVRNNLGIQLLAKVLLRIGYFIVKYDELIDTIERYVIGSYLTEHLIIKNNSQLDNLSVLKILSSYFFH